MPASHHAVIIFFVISGFSVAYAADKVNGNPEEFLAARLSKIFSIAVPAILITLFIDFASAKFHPGAKDLWQLTHWFAYLIFALSFGGELWFISLHPFSNIPFWSLNYELYYYVLFATLLIKSLPIRIISSLIVISAIGPKIVLLLPCWLCGVFLYRQLKSQPIEPQTHRSSSITRALPWAVLAFIYFLILNTRFAQWGNTLTQAYHPLLSYSKDFVYDFALAVAFTACLVLYWHLNKAGTTRRSAMISALAPLTFSIYAMHYPMLQFIAETPDKSRSLGFSIFIVAMVLCLCAVIGIALGPTRHYWRRFILAALQKRH